MDGCGVSQGSRRRSRDELITEHLPLVRAIAIRVHENLPVHVDLDDLVHAGVLGLFEAAEKYDPSKKVTFASYAKHRIKGAILDSLREMDWASRDLRKRHKQVEAAARELAAVLHRSPTQAEIAEKLGVSEERWRKILLELSRTGLVSANGRQAEEEEGPGMDFPAEPSSQPDNIWAREQMRMHLELAMEKLPPRYRQVLELYYRSELTMREIGKRMGINESRVSQIHKSALQKMAAALQEAGIESSSVF